MQLSDEHFLEVIRQNPQDDLAILAYADSKEESGQSLEVQILRGQVQLRANPGDTQLLADLRVVQNELRNHDPAAWQALSRDVLPLVWHKAALDALAGPLDEALRVRGASVYYNMAEGLPCLVDPTVGQQGHVPWSLPWPFAIATAAQMQCGQQLIQAIRDKNPQRMEELMQQGAAAPLAYAEGQSAMRSAVRPKHGYGSSVISPLSQEQRQAIRNQEGRMLDLLHSAGMPPAELHESDNELFFRAAYEGNDVAVRSLLEMGIDPNRRDSRGNSVLQAAVSGANPERCASLLVAAGARIDGEDTDKPSSLAQAVRRNLRGLLPVLLTAGATERQINEALHSACKARHDYAHECVEALIHAGAIVNHVYEGTTPLMVAAYSEAPEVVKTLIAAGADVNEATRKGYTALIAAVSAANSPFVAAVERDSDEAKGFRAAVTRALLDAKANPDAMSDSMGTPLRLACLCGDKKIAEMLLAAGAQVDLHAQFGISPLVQAAEKGHADIVSLLLEYGADVNLACPETALCSAAGRGHAEVVDLLLKAKADPNLQSGAWDTTPLMRAACRPGSEAIIARLLEAGADVSLRDKTGKDAITYAQEGCAWQNNHYDPEPRLAMLREALERQTAAASPGELVELTRENQKTVRSNGKNELS